MMKLVNIEAEQIVLGTLIYDRVSLEALGAASARLAPSDFFEPLHQRIYAALLDEVSAGRIPTTAVLAPMLADVNVDGLSGTDYLFRLARMKDGGALGSCTRAVRDVAARRRLHHAGETLTTLAVDAATPPHQLAADAMAHLNEALSVAASRSAAPQLAGPAAREVLAAIDGTESDALITTGLKGLDRFIGGFPRSELTLIAGRPSMGKSALLMALARRAAMKGVTVLMFSLEMHRRAVLARMLSDAMFCENRALRIPYADILRKEIGPEQKGRLQSLLVDFDDYLLKIDDQAGLTMIEIQMRARRFAEELAKQGKRLDMVIVDHIGKIKASDRYKGNMVHETGEKSDQLMGMAKDLDAAVVAAHQLNRGTEGREDKRPTMADLRDSGNLEQDAHTILFPYRAAYYLERQKFDDQAKEVERKILLAKMQNVLELMVAKNRNGETGSKEFYASMGDNVVEDLESNR